MNSRAPIRRFSLGLLASVASSVPLAAGHAQVTADRSPAASDSAAPSHIVEVVAEDYAFEAPDAIPSGWTTFRLENTGEETHFLYLSRLPEGRTYEEYVEKVGKPVNEVWYALRAGEIGKAGAGERLGAAIPEWYWTGVESVGGPGLVAPGDVAQATLNLEPGTYVLECFMKTAEGEIHWVEGMIRPLTVTAEPSGAPEPSADHEITITAEGFETRGELTPGRRTIAVHFAEQPDVGFGNDIHLVRLGEDTDPAQLAPWMDFLNVRGLENPAPVVFIGGTQEAAEGSTVYFTVELEPGRYAWVSESPEGWVRETAEVFTVGGERTQK